MKTRDGFVRAAWLLLLPALLSAGCSSFELTSAPVADIYENGERLGTTPYAFNLVSGARRFTLKRYGYVEEEVYVSSLAPKRQHINLQWIGRTRVDTLPKGASIVDTETGEELGTTPCSLFLKKPAHVQVRLDGFETIERDVVPNQNHLFELESLSGYKSAFYRKISFSSRQGPVEIYDRIAGELIGITPVTLMVEAGSALEYRLPGCRPMQVLISRNEPALVQIELEPLTRVTLTGPPGAQVYRAGGIERLGEVPYTVEIDGDALFEIKKEGCYDRSVAVSPASPRSLRVDLEAIPYKTIQTDPPGGEVYRLGGLEKLGDAPFTTVVENERVFEIKMQGYRSYVIGVGPSSPAQVSVPLSPVPRDDPDAAAIGNLDSPVVEAY